MTVDGSLEAFKEALLSPGVLRRRGASSRLKLLAQDDAEHRCQGWPACGATSSGAHHAGVEPHHEALRLPGHRGPAL